MDKILNVAFVNSIGKNKWGGGEKWMLNTAKGMQDKGHNVAIACRNSSIISKNAAKLNLQVLSVSYRTDFSLLSILKIRKHLKEHSVDVAICSLNRDVRIIGLASIMLPNKPRVISRQGVQLITKRWKYKLTFDYFADGILTNSKSLKDIYDNFDWWGKDFVKVIYNGIKPAKATSSYNYGDHIKIGSDTKIVLSAGRLSSQKGFEYLIGTAKIAKEKNKDWKFFIAGTGRKYKELNDLIKQNDLGDCVFLLGFQNDISGLLKSSDVFVLPSLYEGMPNVLLEAMQNCKPILTTPVNGSSELVKDGVTGMYIQTRSSESIFEKLEYLFSTPEHCQSMAKKGNEFVLEYFRLEDSVNKVIEYLKTVILAKSTRKTSALIQGIKIYQAKIISTGYKNIKVWYYLKNFTKLKLQSAFTSKKYQSRLDNLTESDISYIHNRVNYYNKIEDKRPLSEGNITLKEFVYTKDMQTYFFDARDYTRSFSPENKFKYVFGDVTEVPEEPAIVKSRPIHGDIENSVLLNLNKVRHFVFVKDRFKFQHKLNRLVWRGNIWSYQPQRVDFLNKHFNNPLCEVGHTNKADIETDWKVEKLTIYEQLKYKFILSIEGNDVATNLKWVMSSNSVAVMPKPKFETWFMEGTLIGDYHYIKIKDDYSDLDDKLYYYINNPDKAEQIRKNANAFVEQFKNKKREDLISLLVLEKYFKLTS